MIKSIEGVRGLAALLVALYHLKIGSEYFSLIRNGYLFVDLFFVLSGFVICAAYGDAMRSGADLRQFIWRRIGRLFPLLVFSTVVFVLGSNAIVLAKKLAVSAGHAGLLNNPGALEYLVPTAGEILATLTFTHSLGLFDELILNTPSWSISVEFYTYLLFALVCLLLTGAGRIVLLAVLSLAGLIISAWASVNIHDCIAAKGCLSLTYDFGLARSIHSFCLGALAFYSSRILKMNIPAIQITVMFALFLLLTLVDYVSIAAFAFPVAFAALVLSLSKDSGPLADALKPGLFQVLGQRSYSIYLMHMPLLLIFENLTKRVSGLVSSITVLVAYVLVLYVISGWTYRFVEAPMRDWFNRLVVRKPAVAGGAGS
ncbi:acyltransferase [Noviherbaspirillum sp.]|uniref:acyltransferase family protein n=1 Tax=Noviherbaspirillum sp. TaxID=1926288 RepID=UPI002D56BD20|nr:acyltransferase [Noviherbaspirillum sp.]HZW23103.1 acyltransferase [Noviherbaspirillum sp.]